jgi:hypothetical protein
MVKNLQVRTLADRRWIPVLFVEKPLFLASLPGGKPVYIILFCIYFCLLLTSNPYYLENHFVFLFFYFVVYMAFANHPMEELEKSLRDYASP